MLPPGENAVPEAETQRAHEDHTGSPQRPRGPARPPCTVRAQMALEPSVVTVTGPDRSALLTDLTLRFGHIELVSEREIILPGGGRGHELTVRHRPFTSALAPEQPTVAVEPVAPPPPPPPVLEQPAPVPPPAPAPEEAAPPPPPPPPAAEP